MEENVELTINGEKKKICGPLSVMELLQELELDPRVVAVELNREILPKAEYGTRVLAGGDRVEIVQFVGGG